MSPQDSLMQALRSDFINGEHTAVASSPGNWRQGYHLPVLHLSIVLLLPEFTY